MHCAKYNKMGLGNLLAHYERKNNKSRKYTNENIDKEKTYLNYNLAPEHKEGLYKFIKDRVEELNIIKRKTAIWCCDWCLTVPENLKDDYVKCKMFFEKSYSFLENRYGKENVVSAYCHFDETTPHLHFCFIPVIKKQECIFDKETGEITNREIQKVLAKEVINKIELNSIHPEMQRFLDEELSFEAKILNGSTKGKNLNMKELKYKTELEQQIKLNEQKLEKMKKDIEILATNFINLNQKITHYNNVMISEQEEREKEVKKSAEHIQNLMNSYDISFDDLLNQVENRDNRIYKLDLSYKKSLEILKEMDKINKETKQLEAEIELKRNIHKKEFDDELDFA